MCVYMLENDLTDNYLRLNVFQNIFHLDIWNTLSFLKKLYDDDNRSYLDDPLLVTQV